ncbi:MAG: SDR family oxidoreductase, partial [Planctomycetales bacterium]|nr:SDR family oxidoreductase [Planctomycetales bacterium]
MSYYATEYTIHFDDTMAYGSHHFLTAFKFQCAVRETFLFDARIFDVPGVRAALDQVHLLTADAYSRQLAPAGLGDRVAILLTIEEWGRASARFCYRVLGSDGSPICAGFQTMICADAKTGAPVQVPAPLWEAMREMAAIEERPASESFRDRVLAGGARTNALFTDVERHTAIQFLSVRHPQPGMIVPASSGDQTTHVAPHSLDPEPHEASTGEVWVFAGQGAFDAKLLSARIRSFCHRSAEGRKQIEAAAAVIAMYADDNSRAFLSGDESHCAALAIESPLLLQAGIHLQNVLGARLRLAEGHVPVAVMGHSLGEIAAMSVAGWFDLVPGIRIVCERVTAIEACAPPGGALLIVGDSRHGVATEAHIQGLSNVVVAGRNHDSQTVVSGPSDELAKLHAYLKARGTSAVLIPSQTSFHHPALRSASLAWRSHIQGLTLGTPTVPVFTPNGRRFISPQENIVDVLTSQLVRPFDLQGAVCDLLAQGAESFVDCGSNGSLVGILSQIVPSHVPVTCAAHDKESQLPRPDSSFPVFFGDRDLISEPTTAGQEEVVESHVAAAAVGSPTVAIVAQGCILPAGVVSPELLHRALLDERMGIVDQSDYDPHWVEDFYSEKLVPDRSTSKLLGHVNDADIRLPDGIDAEVFQTFSRTQRLLCIALAPCLDTLRNADRIVCLIGATADGFEDQDTATSLQFAGLDPTNDKLREHLNLPGDPSLGPHDAIQQVFDQIVRPGIKVTLVDAACASSLYTVALGMMSLESNRADVVIAGGVFCPGPGNSCLFSQFQGTTSTGCRPFDRTADGVVFSEGAAVVVLRRLVDAKRLGMPVQAVVRGAGLSSDGRSPSANVPQSDGQLIALERCYEQYGIDPATIDAIEAHGTSTPIGDATELRTLGKFFARHAKSRIPLHSIKGLLGHAGWSAGTASIIAACQYMKTRTVPRQAGFQQPSNALAEVAETLFVPTSNVHLPSGTNRIAIDGFGFGGANAHVVLDNQYENGEEGVDAILPPGDELVVVGCHDISPTVTTANGRRFDRDRVKPPAECLMLPDLADDLDITQTLCLKLVHELMSQLRNDDDTLPEQTGIVLAHCGKTERGIAATTRVLSSRLRRVLAGTINDVAKIDNAIERIRPSGPYTLQCMMPNVAAGRAALHQDLKGPNFVVDAGSRSIESAIEAATLLLHGHTGTKLVIVAAISATSERMLSVSASESDRSEFATAFAITTRTYAERQGLSITTSVIDLERELKSEASTDTDTMTGQVRCLQQTLRAHPTDASADDPLNAPFPTVYSEEEPAAPTLPIYTPVWIEAEGATPQPPDDLASFDRVVAVVVADRQLIQETLQSLQRCARKYLVVVVGDHRTSLGDEFASAPVVVADMTDEDTARAAIARVARFDADVFIAFDRVATWQVTSIDGDVLQFRGLFEFIFLVAKHNVGRLANGTLELWALLIDGWQDAAHPRSGGVTGLLKAIRREIPASRVGVIDTRGLSIEQGLHKLTLERAQQRHESEVAYHGDTRLVRRLEPTSRVASSPLYTLNTQSIVVASGGARGVTAVLLESLLQETGCTVVALGRSTLEAGPQGTWGSETEQAFYATLARRAPRKTLRELKREYERTRASWEAQRTIERLASLGRVDYESVDITNRDDVARVIQRIAAQYGRIDLILHGAGVQYSKQLQDRRLEDLRATYDVKVAGLHHLVEATQAHTGRTVPVHVLTSAYSIFGNDGQHDYGAANETLDRLCRHYAANHHSRWSSIAWLAWDGIGMTKGSEYDALAKLRGLTGLQAADGVGIFREVISGRTAASINVPLSTAEHVSYAVKTIPRAIGQLRGRRQETPIELDKFPCLRFHQVNGLPTLPGAWILDCFLKAAVKLQHNESPSSVTLENVHFHKFVAFRPDCDPNFRIISEATSSGTVTR